VRILFLDDDHSRCGAFYWANKDAHEVTIVHDVDGAISKLSCGVWDVVSLDHDLEPQHYDDLQRNHERSGMAVAEWIAENLPRIGRVIVHSWNPWGASNMVGVLLAAGYKCDRAEFNHRECVVE